MADSETTESWGDLDPAYRPIVEHYIPEWLGLFIESSHDYGVESYNSLGSKGQFVDINRKVMKLKRAVWEGEPLKREEVREVINDLVGHLFLLRLVLDEEDGIR